MTYMAARINGYSPQKRQVCFRFFFQVLTHSLRYDMEIFFIVGVSGFWFLSVLRKAYAFYLFTIPFKNK